MGIIHRAFKARIYPTQDQETLICKTLGSCRFLYNRMLEERIQVYEKLKEDKRTLYEFKYKTEKEYKEEFEWMKEVDSASLQLSRIALSKAYQNFFKGLSGKSKQRYGFPKFKRKKIGSSYQTAATNDNIKVDFDNKELKLPKLGWIKFRDKNRIFEGKIKQATVSRSSTGKYFVSVLFEQELFLEPILFDELDENKILGLDMSLDKFYVDNLGNSPDYKKFYRIYEKRLKVLQKRTSKKQKTSNNRKKSQLRVNKIHEKITNSRKDFVNKLSSSLVKNYDGIVVEHLSIKGMSQALKLGKSVMDLGYSEFIRQLQYKSLYNNKLFIQADKWFASSKTCSICGFKNKNLELSDRNWNCSNCGSFHDRDINAGKNLKSFGLKEIGREPTEFKPVETKASGQDSKFCLSLVCEAGKSLETDASKSLVSR